MDPLRHASPDNNGLGHTVTWLRIDLGDANMTPDAGVPCAAALARLGGGEEGGLGQTGESEVSDRSSSAVAPGPWAPSSPACIDFWCKTDRRPQQSALGIKHLCCETYENL